MVAGPTPAELAVQILDTQDVPTAAEVLGDWLLRLTGASMAVRVRMGTADGDWQIMASARTELPPPDAWPGPDRLREHPLNRFHRATGSLRPTLLREAQAAGWDLDDRAHEEFERLRLTGHQLTVPTLRSPEPLRRGGWLGWVLVSDDVLDARAVDRLVAALPTVVGADSHLGLLDRLAPAPPEAPPLTGRERMVLLMLAQGRTAAGIASRLAISPRTVHKHQEHLYRKLGAVDRLSAVLAGQRLGLLPAPPLLDPVPEGSVRDRALTPSAAACSLPRPGRA